MKLSLNLAGCVVGLFLFGGHATAQPVPSANSTQDSQPRRIFGILPNYDTADGAIPFQPITVKDKFTIALKDSFDYPVYAISAAFALMYQKENLNPSFGQGMKGYSRRFAASYADQAIGNFMAEAIVPTLFRQDPRYFRIGSGSVLHRTLYAITRVVVARSDNGKWTFNYGEWIGNSAAVAISNTYYPDTRTFDDNVSKLCIQAGTDALSNVLKEFWPDIRNKMHRRKDDTSPTQP